MNIDIESKTLGSVLRNVADKRHDAPFLLCERNSCTYGEFLARVESIARGLMSCGVNRGDKVALWAGNCIEWIEFYFAVVTIGGVLVTVNTRYHADELRYELKQSDASLIVLQRSFLKENLAPRLFEVVPELMTQPFDEVRSQTLPLLRGAVFIDAPSSSDAPGAIGADELARRGETVPRSALDAAERAVRPTDVALMIYTSGTTGAPKGVEQQHSALLNRMSRFCAWNQMNEDDATFFALPLFHSFGAVVAVLGTLVTGSRLCMLEKFRPKEALRLIERERCSVIHGVPSSFYMMLKEPDFSSYDLSCGRTGVLGGAPCPPDLAQQIMDHIAPHIAAAWGQTESCGMVTASAPDDTSLQICETVGRVIPGSEVLIVDHRTGTPIPPGQCGEILVRSNFNMKGYYHMEQETRETIDNCGCLHTGDIGYFDEDGCLHISGRLKDMFIVGGVNAYPVEIENHIRTLEGVDDVQVVGVPDTRLGEVACAYVIKKPNASLSDNDVIAHCSNLANYKIPRYVRFVEEFPTTANGKVKKYVLRRMFSEEEGMDLAKGRPFCPAQEHA